MSVFDSQGPPLAGSLHGAGDDQESPDPEGPGGPATGGMTDEAPPPPPPMQESSLDPHRDARALVRLVQCRRCSLPLRQPLTLACGNSLCRGCLPELHKREHITYPATRGRAEGFMCPFAECGQEHSMGDCSVDVTLAKLLEQVSVAIVRCRPLAPDTPTLLSEQFPLVNGVEPLATQPVAHSRVLNGGRLLATFTLAELGELRYDADVSYQSNSPTSDDYQHLDYGLLDHLREVTRNELDCQVCFALMLDPLTLSCGHTFCRKCVARVLDHAQNCPACRRPLILTPGALQSAHSNQRISNLLLALCPDQVGVRQQQADVEEAELAQNQQIPLFVCTLAYPRIPTFLHIFEPRYRLMIRRAMETDRKFGMLAYNSKSEPQGELGSPQFLQYGTLLEIVNMHLFPNGRSVIETVGVSRFRVQEFGMRDGYTVGRVERIDDIPVAEEETLEAAQVSGIAPSGAAAALLTDPVFQTPQPPTRNSSDSLPALESMPTVQLMDVCTAFIRRMRSASAHWLSDHIIQAYGPMPDDPAVFPYWFASVLPINEAEKYRLLPTRSVRTRLMVCAEWVRRVERTRWYARLLELTESGFPAVLASLHNGRNNDGNDDDDDDYEDEDQSEEELELPPLDPDTRAVSQDTSHVSAVEMASGEIAPGPPTILTAEAAEETSVPVGVTSAESTSAPSARDAAGLAASLPNAFEAPSTPPAQTSVSVEVSAAGCSVLSAPDSTPRQQLPPEGEHAEVATENQHADATT